MAFGIDATSSRNHAQLAAAGVKFVCRYLSHDASKNLTHAEVQALNAHKLGIVTVWETVANRALQGQAAGMQDASDAQKQLAALGAPKNAPVYFAIDFDATPGDQTPINGYFRGAASVLGLNRVGAYGGYWPIKRLFDAKLIRFGWQTLAWSGGNWEKRAQLRQIKNAQTLAGLSVDFDQSTTWNFGQWNAPVPVIPVPKPFGPAKYLIEVDDEAGNPLAKMTARYPALSLAHYNIALHKPASITIARITPGL